MRSKHEREWQTRKDRIDPRLDRCQWTSCDGAKPLRGPYRTEEEETEKGPSDYALWLDGQMVGVVEAKRVTVGPQEVLSQAKRYA